MRLSNKFHISICKEVAEELGVPYKIVEEVFILQWRCVVDGMAAPDFTGVAKPTKVVPSNKLSFSIKGLGKFYLRKELLYNYEFYGKNKNKKNNT